MAGFDYDQALRVRTWPLREVLIAYVNQLRERALADYRHQQLLYRVIVPHLDKKGRQEVKPPKVPPLIKDADGQ